MRKPFPLIHLVVRLLVLAVLVVPLVPIQAAPEAAIPAVSTRGTADLGPARGAGLATTPAELFGPPSPQRETAASRVRLLSRLSVQMFPSQQGRRPS